MNRTALHMEHARRRVSIPRPLLLGALLAGTLAVALAAGASLSAVPEPAIEWDPRSYVCFRTTGDVTVDGRMSEEDWSTAPWTDAFVDIEGPSQPCPPVLTRVKMLWNDAFFYVAAEMEEPNLWGTLTARDAVIYRDNDFEVFIDPDGDTHEYYELEVNALGTEWDLLLVRPYRDGGPAVNAWDIQGLETAVQLDGTLNDPGDFDTAWTIEIAIPWSVLDDCAHRPSPPDHGDRWRVNFSRVGWQLDVENETYAKTVDPETGDALPESNWVWSPQGLIAMHYPEMWGFVEFSDVPVGSAVTTGSAASEASSRSCSPLITATSLRLVSATAVMTSSLVERPMSGRSLRLSVASTCRATSTDFSRTSTCSWR